MLKNEWESLSSSKEFQSLPDDQREAQRTKFFDEKVAPKVPQEKLGVVRAAWDRRTLPKPAVQQTTLVPEKKKPEGERDSAWSYSVDRAQQMVGRGVQAVGGATGIKPVEDAGRKFVERQDKDIEEGGYQPEYEGSFSSNLEESGVGGALGWTGEKLAENWATTGATLAGSLAAVATAPFSAPAALAIGAGTVGVGYLMSSGEAAQEFDEKGIDGPNADRVAMGVGAAMAALDRFGAGKILPKAKLSELAKNLDKMTGEELVGELRSSGAKEVADRVEKTILDASTAAKKSIAKKAGQGFLAEGTTESAQEALMMGAAGVMGGEYQPREVVDRFVDSFLLGGAMGTAFSPFGGSYTPEQERARILQDSEANPGQRLQAARVIAKQYQKESPAIAGAFLNHAMKRISTKQPVMAEGESFYESIKPADRHRVEKELEKNGEKTVLGLPSPTDMGDAPIPVPPVNSGQVEGARAFFGGGFEQAAPSSVRAEDMTLPNTTSFVRGAKSRLDAAQASGDRAAIERAAFEVKSGLNALETVMSGNAEKARQELEKQHQEFTQRYRKEAMDNAPPAGLPQPEGVEERGFRVGADGMSARETQQDIQAREQLGQLVQSLDSAKQADAASRQKAMADVSSQIRELKKVNIDAPPRPERDELQVMIAKLGGLNIEEARAQGLDPAQFSERVGKYNPFRREGMSFDQMAEALSEQGFFTDRNYTANELLEMVDNSVRGNPVYAPAAAEHQARIENLLNTEVELGRSLQEAESRIGALNQDETYYIAEMYDMLQSGATFEDIEAALEAINFDSEDPGAFFDNMGIITRARNGEFRQAYGQEGGVESSAGSNAEESAAAEGQPAPAETEAGPVAGDGSAGSVPVSGPVVPGRPEGVGADTEGQAGTEQAPGAPGGSVEPAVTDSVSPEAADDTQGDLPGTDNNQQPADPPAEGVSGEPVTAPSPEARPALELESEQDGTPAAQPDPEADTRAQVDREQEFFDLTGSENPNTSVSASNDPTQSGRPATDMFTDSRGQRPTNSTAPEHQAVGVIDQAANEAATSPTNDIPAPTDGQIEAGNYRKGHFTWNGLNITVENPKGSTRSGTDDGGNAWENTMQAHYGYLKRTEGADGEHVDVFFGDNADSDRVYIIDQRRDMGNRGPFDEHKVMLGFNNKMDATNAYKGSYSRGWGVGKMSALSVDEFKAWLANGDLTKPYGGQKTDSKAPAVSVSDEATDGPPQSMRLADQLAALSDDDLSTLFDETADEAGAVDNAKPKEKRKRTTRTATGKRRPRKVATKPERTDVTDNAAVERTAGEIAKSLSVNLSGGGKNALEGLTKLFGGPHKLRSGLSFDEETYAEAKPHFEAMLADFSAAGRDLKDLIRAMVDAFGSGVKPYVMRFAKDLREGNANVPGTNTNLERDSQNTGAQDAVGQSGVPDERGTDGRVPGSAGGSAGQGIRGPGGDRVSAGGTAADGKRSDQPAHKPNGAIEPAGSPAGSADAGGRRGPGQPGSPTQQNGSASTGQAVDGAGQRYGERRSVADRQKDADAKPSRLGDLDNIRETLPVLLPEQQEDVHFAEQRLRVNQGRGVLFTNGTGTGKTFTGLGTIKRYVRDGRDAVLIVVPNDKIASDWVKSGRLLNLTINRLKNTKDNGGSGQVITTYANFYQNRSLLERQWDMLVFDESHYLKQKDDFEDTRALEMFRAISGHPRGRSDYHTLKRHDLIQESKALNSQISANSKIINLDDTMDQMVTALQAENERLQARMNRIDAQLKQYRVQDDADHAARWESKNTDTLLLSATPFAYRKSIDYAEGFLFSYGEEVDSLAYNSGGNRERFFVANFGYRMRYNKLTEPDHKVDAAMMEREFSDSLRKSGSIRSRMLEVEQDYDRRFYLVADAIGEKIDDGLTWLDGQVYGDDKVEDETLQEGYSMLREEVQKRFDYLSRAYLLEAIKARHMIPVIRQHLEKGRQVVVFHDYNKGGGFHPFKIDWLRSAPSEEHATESGDKIRAAYRDFVARRPDLQNLDFSGLNSPVVQFGKAFPDAMLFNGTIPKAQRRENVDKFNNDADNHRLIVVQSDAGREGVSLHDTTGEHQRVLINIGLPVKPIASIQTEGRIYRTFVKSDAIQRYVSTGLNMERWAVASKLAARASTAENLAMGNMARGLKDAFVDAYEGADTWPPGHTSEGKGGKELDRALIVPMTEFQRAKAYYWGQQKRAGRRDQREGKDYFATPEPVGMKMVELSGVQPGERVLEPSAGHGAILRWVSDAHDVHYVEPAGTLAAKAAMAAPHAQYHEGGFEDLHIVNKYDAIVMNPPFGQGGKTAAEHVGKAMRHLGDGGRIVALVPTGPAADRQFEKLLESDAAKDIYTVADIAMPAVTFERAGTSVATRILVLEKQTDSDNVAKLLQLNRDYRDAETVDALFDRMENLEIPGRIPLPVDETAEGAVNTNGMIFNKMDSSHSKTGDPLYVVNLEGSMGDNYERLNEIARQHGGFYIKAKLRSYYKPADGVDVPGTPTFTFKSEEDRQKFLADIGLTEQSAGRFRVVGGRESRSVGSISLAMAREAVSAITINWSPITAKRLKVVGSFAELPQDIQRKERAKGAAGNEKGIFHDENNVFVLADNHTSVADLEETVYHEAYGHLGFSGLFGKNIVSKMNELYLMMGGDKGIIEAARRHDVNLSQYRATLSRGVEEGRFSREARNAVLLEELLSHMAQDQRPSVRKKALEVWGMIRNWFRRYFPVTGKLKDADLFYLLKQSRSAVIKNKAGGFYVRGMPLYRTANTKAVFDRRIDELFAGSQGNRRGVMALDRADILDLLGHGNKPLHLVESAVGKTRRDGSLAHPGMTAAQWKRVPEWIDDPVAVFESGTVNGRLTLIAPELVDGKPVLIVLEPNGQMGGLDAHVLVNAYEKDRPESVPTEKWLSEQKLLFLDQKRSPEISERSGLQLPRDVRQLRGYKQRVATEADLVNYRQERGAPAFRQGYHPFTLSGTNPSDNSDTGIRAQAILARNWNGNVAESMAAAIRESKAVSHRDVADWLETNQGRVEGSEAVPRFRTADDVMAEKLGLGGRQANTLANKIRTLKDRNWRSVLDAVGRRAYEGAFDGLIGLKRAEDSVGKGVKVKDYEGSGYVGARLATGVADTMHAILHYGAPMWRGGVIEYKPGTRGLLEVFGDLGEDLNAWLGWMAGNRAAELMAQGRENNLTQEDIDALLKLDDGKRDKFERAKEEYATLNRAMLDLAEGAGLIDGNARADWESEWYVPFYRVSDADGDLSLLAPRTKRGLSHQTAGIKMLKGGEASTNDLLENILTNWLKIADASMHNAALLKSVDNLRDTELLSDETVRWQQVVVSKSEIAKRIKSDRKTMAAVADFLGMGDGATLEEVANELAKVDNEGFEKMWGPVAPKDPDIIRVQRNGKNEYYRVHDESLLRAVTHMNNSGFNDPVTRTGRWFKRMLTTGVTASPDFILRNFVRDAAHAWAISPKGDKFTFGKDSLKGLRDAIKQDPAYRELMFAGASFQGGYVHGTDPEASAQMIRRALEKKGLTRQQVDSHMNSLLDTPHKLQSALLQGWQKYRELGDKVENANRLSTFKAARASGKPLAQAVFEAKDLMDYSLRGNFMAMNWLTDVVPFLNARLQGLSKLARAGKADPAAVGMAIGKIALFSVFLAALNDDDEKYQGLPDWEKDAYWHIFLGDHHWRIPKPFEIGIIAGTIPERIYHAWLTDNQPPDKVRQALVHGMADTLNFNPLPQAIVPAIETWGNRSFYFDTPIEGMADEGKRPEDRYNAYTSELAVKLGQMFGVSPKKLQHLWEGYTGTMGAYALSTADMLVRAADTGDVPKPAWSVSDLPAVKSFYRGTAPARNTQYITDLYDRLEEVNQIHRSLNDFAKYDREKAGELLEENRDKLKYRGTLNKTSKALADLRKAKNRVMKDPNMTPKAKKDMIDGINARINRISAQAARVTEGAF